MQELVHDIQFLRLACVLFAPDGYTALMPINPTTHALIVKIQTEYNAASREISVRYVLEIPSSGEHRGFVDIKALMSALGIELAKIATPIVTSDPKEEKPGDEE